MTSKLYNPTFLIGVAGVAAMVAATLSPLVAAAQEREGDEWWGQLLARHNDDDRRSDRRDSEEAADELDDDRVDDLPIPVLFGVSLGDITPNFGDPRGGGAREHEGLDMLAPYGTPVVSPTEAIVRRVGDGRNSGITVSTYNPGGERFVYMHLAEAADLERGDELEVGDLIGYVGDTGNAEGGPAHLHFEVRDGREALDPYPRVTQEFALEEKMALLERMLDGHDREEAMAEWLVYEFAEVFQRAATEGLALPSAVASHMTSRIAAGDARVTGSFTRDLDIGDDGADVSSLQRILIREGHLDIGEPTGYFGPLTQAALAAYQEEEGITPAIGYFGPATRASLADRPPAAELAGETGASGTVSAADLVRLLLALQIIPPEKEAAAYAAIEGLQGA